MKTKLQFLTIVTFVFAFCSCHTNKTIKWWTTSEQRLWDEQRNQFWQPIDSTDSKFDAEIFPDSLRQQIDGFGGCFNEMGWGALQVLNDKSKNYLMHDLFGTEYGLKLNYCRVPIGSNDYSFNYYSLDDSINDFDLEFFSIDRDKRNLIPYIKTALSYQKKLKLWASPWTPPAWMKTNDHYACKPGYGNKLKRSLKGKEGVNQLILNDTILSTYAKYFAKFIKAYRDEGINISMVQPQNEFNSCQVFPSCVWTPSALADFMGNYLGPRFEKDKLKTEIWFGTLERPSISIIDTIMQNEKCRKYIKGFGFQWAGKGAVEFTHENFPNLKIMQTENECGNGDNDWKAAEHTYNLIKFYFNAGANSYMYWNMILEKPGMSHWGWRQNSLISIDPVKKRYFLNPEYFVFKHFSYFITPGSNMIKTKGSENIISFITPDKDLVMVIDNPNDKPKIMKIKVLNKKLIVKIPPKTFNTFFCYNIKY
jgi:glucosylceramidase